MLHFVWLLGCAAAIYLSCEWFVNAVEWLGRRMNVGKMAVGTILAAFGTALPESVVTLVAVATGGTEDAKDIGVGAALGGPLALATLAYGVTGLMLVFARRSAGGATQGDGGVAGRALGTEAQTRRLATDQQWFLPIFIVKVALGLVAFAFKPVLGVLFFAAYVVYFWHQLKRSRGQDEEDEELEPLKFQPRSAAPATWAVVAQTVVALAVIFFASQWFVRQLDAIGPMIGLSSSVTALLLAPVATELPETMNAIIWVRQGKTQLALANISGSMMIQATVPSGLGLLFTRWRLNGALIWSGAITMCAIGYLLAL
ncbi:MAG: sodium:calcium antiporter, partial [Actinomycetia bacterium]|nr:sodium:calcium antiporter [Actinomycetes bacterium]